MEAQGLATGLAPRLDVPLRYLLAGPAFYAAAQAVLLARAGDLAAGAYLSGPVAGAAHLLTLGWATMVMMGATLQLVPVLLRVPVASERLARLAWWPYTAGAALLGAGLLAWRREWLAPAGALALAGVLLYAADVGVSLARAPRGPLQRPALAAATAFLAATALLGAALALALGSGAPGPAAFRPLLGAHLAGGLGGWMTLTAFAVGYRLVPMFALSHGYARHRQRPALLLAAAGAAGIGLGALGLPAAGAGALALAAAYAVFAFDVADIVRHRRRRRLELVTRFTLAGLAFALASLALAAVAAVAAGAARPGPAGAAGLPAGPAGRLTLAAGYAFLGGWISLLIMGHLLKIVPFLTWLERYADRAAAEKVPLVRDLFSPRLGEAALWLTAAGAAVALAALLLGSAPAARAGFSLTLGGAAAFLAALVQVRAGWRQPPRP